jgi:hypothetical protein
MYRKIITKLKITASSPPMQVACDVCYEIYATTITHAFISLDFAVREHCLQLNNLSKLTIYDITTKPTTATILYIHTLERRE